MMKLLLLPLCLISAIAAHDPTAFQRHALFGIRGGDDNTNDDDGDYDRAEKAIFHGIHKVEERVQKAVEDEVHSIFDADDPATREKVAEHAKTAVQRGTAKVKAQHSKFHLFLPKEAQEVPHDDHKILHAMEAAEKAVLHAVQEEVDTLFHPTHDEDHPLKEEAHKKHVQKAQKTVQRGVQKAKKDTEEHHVERKKWMHEMDAKSIDEYLKTFNSMYGMGF